MVERFASWTHEHNRLLHQNPHTPSRPQYKKILLTHIPANAIVHDVCTLIHYIHSQLNRHDHHGISIASQKYKHISLLWVTKNAQAKLRSPPIISGCDGPTDPLYRILPTSSCLKLNLKAWIFHHTLRTQNISSTSLKIFHYFQPMHSWSQLMSPLFTHKFNMMEYQPSLISWRSKSISYPQTTYLPIQFMQFAISFLNIAPSIS